MQKVKDQTQKLTLMACEWIGADPDTVCKFRIDEARDEVYLLLDLGIKGVPKHTFSLSELVAKVEETKTAEVAQKEVTTKVEKEIDATRGAVKLAGELGVDLGQLKKRGRISVPDVRAAVAGGK